MSRDTHPRHQAPLENRVPGPMWSLSLPYWTAPRSAAAVSRGGLGRIRRVLRAAAPGPHAMHLRPRRPQA